MYLPERCSNRKNNPPDRPLATVCDGARAATTKPRENITAIERTVDRTKYGILTSSAAPNTSSLPKMTIKIVTKASTRLRVNGAASSLHGGVGVVETLRSHPISRYLTRVTGKELIPREINPITMIIGT